MICTCAKTIEQVCPVHGVETTCPPAGTWDVIDRHGEPRYVVEHDGKGGWWGVCQPDRLEDCYVLAASKDLLAALKVYQFMEQTYAGRNPHVPNTNAHRAFDLGRAAIAKAEGK